MRNADTQTDSTCARAPPSLRVERDKAELSTSSSLSSVTGLPRRWLSGPQQQQQQLAQRQQRLVKASRRIKNSEPVRFKLCLAPKRLFLLWRRLTPLLARLSRYVSTADETPVGAEPGGGVLKSHYLEELARWSKKTGDNTAAAARPLMK